MKKPVKVVKAKEKFGIADNNVAYYLVLDALSLTTIAYSLFLKSVGKSRFEKTRIITSDGWHFNCSVPDMNEKVLEWLQK